MIGIYKIKRRLETPTLDRRARWSDVFGNIFCLFSPHTVVNVRFFVFLSYDFCGNSSVGRASASQAEGHGFESRLPLGDVVQGSVALRYFFKSRTRDPHRPFQGLGV